MRRLVFPVTIAAALAVAFGTVKVADPPWWDRIWYPLRYEQIVRGHARNYHLDATLLAAVIYEESKFRADARSRAGAIGLMQLLPATAKGIALHTGGTRFRVGDLYDPEINVRYGAWYLRHLLDKYKNERLALAAYNAGQHNVDTWLREGKGLEFRETRSYVARVEHLKTVYGHAYGARLSGQSRGHLTDVKMMSNDHRWTSTTMSRHCSAISPASPVLVTKPSHRPPSG